MSDDRLAAYQDAAGLLSRMGYVARAEAAWTPPATLRRAGSVPAIITDAPPIVVGYAVAMVAEEPEAHLPDHSARAGRSPTVRAEAPLGRSGSTTTNSALSRISLKL